ncbi:MAG: hypothetical protein KGH59_04045 [Candidatus Micrarchaeota archaeon]|nr:hypothetical protein [Candidatus Micrarchaeota archaeon]
MKFFKKGDKMWNFLRHGEDTQAKPTQPEPQSPLKKIFDGMLVDAHKHREIRDRKDDKDMMQEIAFGKNPLYRSNECMALATQFIDDKDVLLLLFKKPGVPPLVQENIVYKISDKSILSEFKSHTQNSRVKWKIEDKLQGISHHESLLEAAFSSESHADKIKSMNQIRDSGSLNNHTIEMFIDEFKKQASAPTPSSWYMEAILEAIPRSQTSDQYKYNKITELEGAIAKMEDGHEKKTLRSTIAIMKQTHVCLLHGKMETEEKPVEE